MTPLEKIGELRQYANQKPFIPFGIDMGGQIIDVSTPDCIAFSPSRPLCIVLDHQTEYRIFGDQIKCLTVDQDSS